MTLTLAVDPDSSPPRALYGACGPHARVADRLRRGEGSWWLLDGCAAPEMADAALDAARELCRSRVLGHHQHDSGLLLWLRDTDARRLHSAYLSGRLHTHIAAHLGRTPAPDTLSDLRPVIAAGADSARTVCRLLTPVAA